MSSIREVTSYLFALEEKLQLLTIRFEDSYPYSFLRTRIVTEVEKQLGLLSQPHDIPKPRTRWQRYFDYVYYDWLYLVHRGQYDLLVIEHERQIETEEGFIDIYTHDIVQKRGEQEQIMCIRRSPKRSNQSSKGKQILLREGFLDLFDRDWRRYKETTPSFAILDEFSQQINDHFGIQIDVNAMLRQEWRKFIRCRLRFQRWLRKYQPKEVIVSVGYYAYEFIEACKLEHILVSEVQHGILDQNHSGYSYPYQQQRPDLVPYFVDRMYLFGGYWQEVCPLPLKEEQIKVIGFGYFRNNQAKYNIKRHHKQVLLISQGTIGEQLADLAIKLALAYPDHQFVYKLHPGEFLHAKERYPHLQDAPDNLLVVKNEVPLYYWLHLSTYVIGAYSTAIYEAMALGCKIFLFATKGVEDYMSYLITHRHVLLIHTSDEFADLQERPVEPLNKTIF